MCIFIAKVSRQKIAGFKAAVLNSLMWNFPEGRDGEATFGDALFYLGF